MAFAQQRAHCPREHFILNGSRNHDHTITVGKHEIARIYVNTVKYDGHVHGSNRAASLDVPTSCATRKHRKPRLSRLGGVSGRAADDGADGATPNSQCHVQFAKVCKFRQVRLNDYDVITRHIVITIQRLINASRRLSRLTGSNAQRTNTTEDLGVWKIRPELRQQHAIMAQFIEHIRQDGGVEKEGQETKSLTLSSPKPGCDTLGQLKVRFSIDVDHFKWSSKYHERAIADTPMSLHGGVATHDIERHSLAIDPW